MGCSVRAYATGSHAWVINPTNGYFRMIGLMEVSIGRCSGGSRTVEGKSGTTSGFCIESVTDDGYRKRGPASVVEGFFRSLIVVHRLNAHLLYNNKAITIIRTHAQAKYISPWRLK